MKRPSARTALLALSVGLSTSACGVEETGIPPPIDALYYPVGLAAHPDGRYLYVANAGFDRRYNPQMREAYLAWVYRWGHAADGCREVRELQCMVAAQGLAGHVR